MKKNMITVFVFGTRPVSVTPKVAARRKAKYPVDNNPVVTFDYPHSNPFDFSSDTRTVKLIGADARYYVGLEVTQTDTGKVRHQFKKFLRNKARNFRLVSFAPESIS